MCVHVCVSVCLCACVCVHACVHACEHACVCACIHASVICIFIVRSKQIAMLQAISRGLGARVDILSSSN